LSYFIQSRDGSPPVSTFARRMDQQELRQFVRSETFVPLKRLANSRYPSAIAFYSGAAPAPWTVRGLEGDHAARTYIRNSESVINTAPDAGMMKSEQAIDGRHR
jgi:hypothetical protein